MNELSELDPAGDGLDGVFVFDREYRYTEWNPAMERLTGLPRAQVLGRSVFEVFRSLQGSGTERCLREALAGRSAVSAGTRYPAGGTGGEVRVEESYSPVRDPSGAVVGGKAVVRIRTGPPSAPQVEPRFRALIEKGWEAVILVDASAAILYSSQSAVEIWGYSLAETLGRNAFEFVHPEDAPRVRELFLGLLQTPDGTAAAEYRVRHRDGSWRWTRSHGTNMLREPGVGAVVIHSHDVTDRKRAEQALRRSEERYRALASNFPNGAVFLFSRELRYVVADGQGLSQVGLSSEELTGKTIWEALPPEVSPAVEQIYREVLAGREVACEAPFLDRIYDVRGVPLRDDDGEVTAGLVVTQDITDRRQLDAALRTITAHAPCILFHADVEAQGDTFLWRVCLADEEAAQRVFPLDTTEEEGYVQAWWRSRNREDNARMREVTTAALRAGRTSYSQEFRCVNRFGEERWLFEDVHLEPRGPGRWRAVGVCTDITERKWLEAVLRQQARDLAAADRRKDQFMAMLGHELRNPLAAISNALYVLEHLPRDDRQLQRMHAIVQRQTQHLSRLVDDLLDLARITEGKVELRPERMDLCRAARRVAESMDLVIRSRSHELTVSIPEGPLWAQADPARFEQILSNLLNNAAKYTDPGGRIQLSVEREPSCPSLAVIRVQDSGSGIDPSILPHVFDLFTQADTSLDRSQGGLGIGLTLVRRLVELHGGTVEAHSEGIGQGSEFVVRLPLRVDERRGAVSANPVVASESQTRAQLSPRVLVVEDNPDAAETLVEILELWGCRVRVAGDGLSALDAAAAYQPHVVLLDIGLPGMDGYEVARHLRQIAGLKGALLVALTGYGQDGDRRRSRDAGFDHHLVKPVAPDALRQVLGGRFPEKSIPGA